MYLAVGKSYKSTITLLKMDNANLILFCYQ